MTVLSQEPVEIVAAEEAVNYPKKDTYQNFIFSKWKRSIILLVSIFIIGQLFSFGIHVSIQKIDMDEIVENVLGENAANIVRWLGSEGQAWGVFLEESGLKDTVYSAVGMVKEKVEETIDPFVWWDPTTW